VDLRHRDIPLRNIFQDYVVSFFLLYSAFPFPATCSRITSESSLVEMLTAKMLHDCRSAKSLTLDRGGAASGANSDD